MARRLACTRFFGTCPEEFPATDWMYRIKSDQEGFERTVLECALSPSIVPETSYERSSPCDAPAGITDDQYPQRFWRMSATSCRMPAVSIRDFYKMTRCRAGAIPPSRRRDAFIIGCPCAFGGGKSQSLGHRGSSPKPLVYVESAGLRTAKAHGLNVPPTLRGRAGRGYRISHHCVAAQLGHDWQGAEMKRFPAPCWEY